MHNVHSLKNEIPNSKDGKDSNNSNSDLLTRKEAAAFLRVSLSMLDAHLNIPKIKIGRKVLYSKSTLLNFLKEAEQDGN